jgi:hypothetical protein
MNTFVSNRLLRAALLASLVAVPVSAQQPASAGLPSAREIHAKYVNALGGEEVIKKHSQMHLTGTFEIPAAGMNGTLEIWSLAPDKLMTVQEIAGVGSLRTGYDGKVAWQLHPMTGAQLLTGKQLEQVKQQADFLAVLTPDKYFQTMETVEKTNFDGKEAYKIKIVTKAGEEYFEFYDVASGLNIGTIRKQESPMGAIESTSYLSEHKTFDGHVVPTKMRQAAMGMESVVVINKVEFSGVDPKVFELPKEIKAISSN